MSELAGAAARRCRCGFQRVFAAGLFFVGAAAGLASTPEIKSTQGIKSAADIADIKFAERNDSDSFPPRAHAAWVYDIANLPGRPRQSDPGFFAPALNEYNRRAGLPHKIRMVYTYSGSLEMYCPGRNARQCREEDLIVTYQARGERSKGAQPPSAGTLTAHAYRQSLETEKQAVKPAIVAVLDGVVNADYEGSMRGFNELPQPLAEAFADKVAREVCSEPLIDGVQFDIEPFDVSHKNGQYFFYRRIAKNFSGSVPAGKSGPEVKCRDNNHPRGRFFSVFAVARHLRADAASGRNMQSIMTVANNGYVIVPLYDLGSKPLGYATPLDVYQRQVHTQVTLTRRWAKELGVAYQFGIPAAASVHEYADCAGEACVHEHIKHRSQLAYVKAVLEVIQASGAREDSLYLGNAVWAWSRGIVHGGARFQPQTPPDDVMAYMAENL